MRNLPISPEPELTVEEKFRITMDLAEAGIDVMRENLRREYPDATAGEIERRLVAWLQYRPGAELGDAEGVPCRRFPQA